MGVLTRDQLSKLSQEELLNYSVKVGDIEAKLDEMEARFLEKFYILKTEFENKFIDLKQHSTERFEKLEGELAIVKNANHLLKEECEKHNAATYSRFVDIERATHSTAQYSQYETLELSIIPRSIPDNEVQTIVKKIVNAIKPDGATDISDGHIQACHRRQGKYTKEKVLLKLVNRPDVYAILQRRSKLKDIALSDIDERLNSPIYINEHLTRYYANLRYMCKKL